MIISTERWRVWAVCLGLLLDSAVARKPQDPSKNGRQGNMSQGRNDNGDKNGNSGQNGIGDQNGDGGPKQTPKFYDAAPMYYQTTWNIGHEINLDEYTNATYKVDSAASNGNQSLALCYVENPSLPTSDNAYVVMSGLIYVCNFNSVNNDTCLNENQSGGYTDLTFGLPPQSNTSFFNTGGFFLCFYTAIANGMGMACTSYSPWFQISDSAGEVPTSSEVSPARLKRDNTAVLSLSNLQPPTTILSVLTSASNILTSLGATSTPELTPTSGDSTSTSIVATVTASPTSIPTDASEATSTPLSSSSSSSGLSLGAKIGIALGAIIFAFLLLLLALLMLRRRHRKVSRQPPSQTPENRLLASSLENNESRGIFIAEKAGATSSVQEHETHTPLTSTTELYDDLAAPGSAFTTSTPVPISPRRSQAATTISRSEMDVPLSSRAVSNASHISRPSNLTASGLQHNHSPLASRDPSRERVSMAMGERSLFDEEPYSDDADSVHTTGTGSTNAVANAAASNVPKVYQGALQAPFLSEPGMSAEEVAKLEEEERKIDEAIAEAEEERARARMR